MASELLTTAAVKALEPKEKRYLVNDGNRLYLSIAPSGSKRWLSRVDFQGHTIETALGPWPEVSLDDARRRHRELRALVREGRDPRLPASMSFAELWQDWIDTKTPEWGATHAFQNRRLGELYLLPAFGRAEPGKITPLAIRNMLLPFFRTKPATGRKLLSALSQVLRHGAVLGLLSSAGRAEEEPETHALRAFLQVLMLMRTPTQRLPSSQPAPSPP
ncbi:MAG: Arm DNA-binding domain-containing protein [Desulfovibrio sp.]|nr:Arm DNA-binding domain-containing protein [Desulfovibrio sp.]